MSKNTVPLHIPATKDNAYRAMDILDGANDVKVDYDTRDDAIREGHGRQAIPNKDFDFLAAFIRLVKDVLR